MATRPRIQYSAPKPTPIPLTQQGYDEMQKERDALRVKREEVMERLVLAREQGDLSENGAYHAAKFELGTIGRQLRRLNEVLAVAFVPQDGEQTKGKIDFGSQITLRNKDNEQEMTFTLVSQHESDPSEHKLSMESPIGQAVMGKRVGDEVEVVTPKGALHFAIMQVD